MRFIMPLIIFLGLGALLFFGLGNDPKHVPSVLIDKQAPDFQLPVLGQPDKTIGKNDLLGQVYILNVWASWCVACRSEHPVLMEYVKTADIEIYGLNYKDKITDATRWLKQFGDPYAASLSDLDGRTGIDFGVYGAPETFLIDQQGVIRHKHIGPLGFMDLRKEFEPRIKQLREEGSQ